METTALNAVVDAVDIETYLLCSDAKQGHALALQLGREMNLGDKHAPEMARGLADKFGMHTPVK